MKKRPTHLRLVHSAVDPVERVMRKIATIANAARVVTAKTNLLAIVSIDDEGRWTMAPYDRGALIDAWRRDGQGTLADTFSGPRALQDVSCLIIRPDGSAFSYVDRRAC